MNDLINRQAAIDVIAETDITNGTEPVFTGKQVQALLRDLPSVTPKQIGWTPVSERLPEEYGEYLITWITSQSKKPFIAICECEISNLYNFEKNRFDAVWLLEDYIKAYPDVEIIAWRPLPEPYTAESEGAE